MQVEEREISRPRPKRSLIDRLRRTQKTRRAIRVAYRPNGHRVMLADAGLTLHSQKLPGGGYAVWVEKKKTRTA